MKTNIKLGDQIVILKMRGEKNYDGKVGIIQLFDDEGYIHGTWGGCALDPKLDNFIIDNTL